MYDWRRKAHQVTLFRYAYSSPDATHIDSQRNREYYLSILRKGD